MNNVYDYYNYMNNLDNYNRIDYGMYNQNDLIRNNNFLDPYTGFIRGNLFRNLYDQYKNYKPKELKAASDRQNLMMQIQELDFAMNDLGLYLDIYKNDMEAINLFNNYSKQMKELKNMYEQKYGLLLRDDNNSNNWRWDNNPWPWEVQK